LLEYQRFRESLADQWAETQAQAIKSADPAALVTVGLIQWSVPTLLPGGVRHYSGFNPQRQAKFLDFMEVHFYPLARGAYDYQRPEDEIANMAYLESVVREVTRPGKPVVLAEFGWYGGGKPTFDGGVHPAASEEQQARYCENVIMTSGGMAAGWLNWGFYDQPEAKDVSELTGLLKADGKEKAWGISFARLAAEHLGKPRPSRKIGDRPEMDWNACLTSSEAGRTFHAAYLRALEADGK
jgi:hypothetical protein